MQIGYSFIHLFSIHAFSCPLLSLCSSGSCANCHFPSFVLFLFDGLLSQLASFCFNPHRGHTAANHRHYCDHTRDVLIFPSAVCTCLHLLSCSCAIPQACTRARKTTKKRNENSEAESLSVSSVRVFPARACARLTDLSGANDKLSPTGELLLTSLISSPTSSVISTVPLLYLVFTH